MRAFCIRRQERRLEAEGFNPQEHTKSSLKLANFRMSLVDRNDGTQPWVSFDSEHI